MSLPTCIVRGAVCALFLLTWSRHVQAQSFPLTIVASVSPSAPSGAFSAGSARLGGSASRSWFVGLRREIPHGLSELASSTANVHVRWGKADLFSELQSQSFGDLSLLRTSLAYRRQPSDKPYAWIAKMELRRWDRGRLATSYRAAWLLAVSGSILPDVTLGAFVARSENDNSPSHGADTVGAEAIVWPDTKLIIKIRLKHSTVWGTAMDFGGRVALIPQMALSFERRTETASTHAHLDLSVSAISVLIGASWSGALGLSQGFGMGYGR